MGLGLCLTAFVACWWLGSRSVTAGLGAVLSIGYLYGILRANFLDSFTHFIFDSAAVGFYGAMLFFPPASARGPHLEPLWWWVKVLLGWSFVMFLLPLQHPLIQLVGLRGNGFLLPFLLFGGWLRGDDARRLALWMAALNVMAFGFGAAEFVVGVEPFYPVNAVTELIYKSGDVAGYTAYRIPACFSNAHSYGGTMVSTLPWLLGALVQPGNRVWQRGLLVAGTATGLLGVFMCAARMHVLLLLILVCSATFSGKLRTMYLLGWLLILGGIAYVVSGEERLQRFLSLQETDLVGRIEGSVNMGFMELMVTYPIGNGMGAGGTSIPFFLVDLLHNPVGLENEYCRLMLEQGIPGLLLWLAFIVWVVQRRPHVPGDPWLLGRRLLWYLSLASFAIAALGTGLLTAIPQSMLFFLGIGFLTTPPLLRPVPEVLRRLPARTSLLRPLPVPCPAPT
jgi:hypothetical protein